MSALLDKLLVTKTSVAVQTDWKSAVTETRDVGVATDRRFRQRWSALPPIRSMSTQTEVSALKYKDESVATDPEITGLCRMIRMAFLFFTKPNKYYFIHNSKHQFISDIDLNFNSFLTI